MAWIILTSGRPDTLPESDQCSFLDTFEQTIASLMCDFLGRSKNDGIFRNGGQGGSTKKIFQGHLSFWFRKLQNVELLYDTGRSAQHKRRVRGRPVRNKRLSLYESDAETGKKQLRQGGSTRAWIGGSKQQRQETHGTAFGLQDVGRSRGISSNLSSRGAKHSGQR